jgi:hypothetical protein
VRPVQSVRRPRRVLEGGELADYNQARAEGFARDRASGEAEPGAPSRGTARAGAGSVPGTLESGRAPVRSRRGRRGGRRPRFLPNGDGGRGASVRPLSGWLRRRRRSQLERHLRSKRRRSRGGTRAGRLRPVTGCRPMARFTGHADRAARRSPGANPCRELTPPAPHAQTRPPAERTLHRPSGRHCPLI